MYQIIQEYIPFIRKTLECYRHLHFVLIKEEILCICILFVFHFNHLHIFIPHVIMTCHFSSNLLKIVQIREFPGGLVAKTLHSHCRGLRFDPCSGNQNPQLTIQSSYAATKDGRSCMPQLRPSTTKRIKINKLFF